jgi:hypothetical protein
MRNVLQRSTHQGLKLLAPLARFRPRDSRENGARVPPSFLPVGSQLADAKEKPFSVTFEGSSRRFRQKKRLPGGLGEIEVLGQIAKKRLVLANIRP